MIVPRSELFLRVQKSVRENPVTALIGPRQCGKTTLAHQFSETRKCVYFDLERPTHWERLSQPMTALEPLRGLIIIDEVQLKPDVFPVLRVLADRRPLPARFLVLGSASPDLLRSSSESLAGRITYINMSGFHLNEVGPGSLRNLWWRGGFPRSYLAKNQATSRSWRENFIQTFLERDIRKFGVQVPPVTLRRFWSMLAHYHGQIWNASEISRSLGESHTTIRRHLDILTGAFMVRQLSPWFENLAKRQIKAPKVYLRDSGILHELLGVGSFAELEGHPKLGASWEGFVIEEILRVTGDRQAYFWGTYSGNELDVFLLWQGRRVGIEVKYADAPRITPSMRIAIQDLALHRLLVVYPGKESFPLEKPIEAISIFDLHKTLLSGS